MAVKISIVTLTMVMSCAMAVELPVIPMEPIYPPMNYNPGGPNYPPMSYNPESPYDPTPNDYSDSKRYQRLQQDLKGINHATFNLMITTRGLEDYQGLYVREPEVYGQIYAMKLAAYKDTLHSLMNSYSQLDYDYSHYDPSTTAVDDPSYPSSPYDPSQDIYNHDPSIQQYPNILSSM